MPITSYQPAEQQSDEQQQDYRRHQSQENYGAVLKLPQRLDMVAMPMPPLKDGYVQVQMKTVSVSDADVRLWKNGSTPNLLGGSDSVVLGCEGAGVVTAVGAHVHNLRVGDRVVVEPCIPCRMCDRCISGRYNLCLDLAILGTAKANGLFQKFVTHPAPWLHRIPDGLNHVSFKEAALMEPLSTAIAALDRAAIGLGQSLLITGCNVLACLVLKVARATGINPIVVAVDREESREQALSMGADQVYVMDPIQRDHEVATDLRALIAGNDAIMGGVEAAVECTGQEMFLRVAIMATQPGGTCCRIATGNYEQTVPVSVLAMRSVTLSGVNRSHHVYPRALELVASGRLQLGDLISEEYGFDDLQQALEVASLNGEAQKVQINI